MVPEISITMTIPDLRRGKQMKMWRDALDKALQHHRDTYLPRHFEEHAKSRYGSAYQRVGGSSAGKRFRDRLATMSAQERSEFWAARNIRREIARIKEEFAVSRIKREHPEYSITQDEWAAFRRTPKEQRAIGGPADPQGKIPLVSTGVARTMMLTAVPRFSLPVSRRRMSIPVPRYMRHQRSGQIDKERAVQAVIPQETNVFANGVARHLQQTFRTDKVKLP